MALLLFVCLALPLIGCSTSEVSSAADMQPAEHIDVKSFDAAERIDPTNDGQGETGDSSQGDEATAGTSIAGDGGLVARFLDVGQGDAALVTCDGHSMLIDGGPSSASSKLYSVLKAEGIDALDYVIASHPDADHIGGLAGALHAAKAGRVFCSSTSSDTKTYETFASTVLDGGGVVEVPSTGTTLPLGGASVSFIGPVVRFGDDNNDSLVVKVTYGETSMLFMGDAEMSAEQTLLDEGVDVRADVLKVGHHGSQTSSSPFFVEEVDPEFAVISVGENSYGHPDENVLAMFGRMGVNVLRTDVSGDIALCSNGCEIVICDS